MESLSSRGEFTKDFEIKDFSGYSTSSEITAEFPITLDDFKSAWQVTVYPMQLDKSNIEDPINCDVVIRLTCISCSAPVVHLKNLEIFCTVRGRENYPKEIKRLKSSTQPIWKEMLISRAALQTCSNLLVNNCLRFQLRFSVSNEILSKCENGSKQIGEHLGRVLADPEYYDACLISVSGSKFLVHSAILQARSNFMKIAQSDGVDGSHNITDTSDSKLCNLSSCLDSTTHGAALKPKNNIENCAGFTNGESSDNNDSLYDSCYSRPKCSESPYKRSPLFVVSSSADFTPKLMKTTLSPSILSPDKRRVTPKKRPILSVGAASGSPSKRVQTQLTNYFQRCSSMKNELDSSNLPTATLQKVAFLSPIKCISQGSPTMQSKFRATADSPRNIGAVSGNLVDPYSPFKINEIIRSPCGTKPSNVFQEPKRKLFNDSEVSNNKLAVMNVRMSTSVTQELLRWIYTGESHRLAELSKPLMVAAIRYEVPSLARASQLHLSSILEIENCPEMLILGHKYKANILKDEAMLFAVAHACDVTALLSWAELSLRYPDLMLEFTRRLALKTS